jgi:predicted MFS family arabinose efflux permease
MMAAGLILACLFIRNSPEEMGLRPLRTLSETPGTDPTTTSTAPSPDQYSRRTGAIWGEVLRNESFWLLSLTHFFCCVCHAIPLVHVAAFANVAGLSALASAWVLGLMGLMAFVGRIYWGFFADKHGSRFALMLTAILQAVFMLWLMNAADPIVFVLYAVFWGFGYAGVTIQYGIIAKDIFPKHLMTIAFAGVSCFAMVGMALGGYLGGLLADISHTYVTAWWVSLISGLIAALIAMDMARKAEQERQGHGKMARSIAETTAGVGDHTTETGVHSRMAKS